jgi:hypothetical protein
MPIDTYALAANIAMRHCADPVAAMKSWGFKTPLGPIPGGGALDALPRGLRRAARDQDPTDDPEVLDRVMQFLQTKLDPDDFADLCELVGAEPPPPVEEDPDDIDDSTDMEVARPEAEDTPPPFRGRPNAGGAQDAAARSFARRFPNAGRVGIDNAGITLNPRGLHPLQARADALWNSEVDPDRGTAGAVS